MNNINLYNGDCLVVMQQLIEEGIKVDAIITSPPYNLNIEYNSYNDNISIKDYIKWCNKWIDHCINLLKDSGRICINMPFISNVNGGRHFIINDYMNILNSFNLIEMAFILWDKRHIISRTAWGSWLSPSCPYVSQPNECILVYAKGSCKKEGNKNDIDISKEEFIKNTLGVWELQPESNRSHPAPFPLSLPTNLMKLFTYKNDLILDPFMGSGTTGVACKLYDRNFIGIEIDKKYFDMAKDRIDKTYKPSKLF